MRFLALVVALVNLLGLVSFSALPHCSAPATGAVLSPMTIGLNLGSTTTQAAASGFKVLIRLVRRKFLQNS